MMRRLSPWLLMPLMLAGCQSSDVKMAANYQDLDAKPATASPADPNPVNPIEDYRRARMRDAMAGLDYSTGLVTIDQAAAAKIVSGQDVSASQAAYADGVRELNAGNAVDAIGAFTRSILLDPSKAENFDALATALVLKGRIAEAQAAYRTSLNLNPHNVETRVRLGDTLYAQGNLEGSIGTWQEVLQREPNHGETHAMLAVAYYFQGNFAAAWQHVHAAEQNNHPVPAQFRPMLASQMSEPAR